MEKNEFSLASLKKALHFTEVFKKHMDDPAPLREAICLRAQFPAILGEIQENDLFAGRHTYAYAGYLNSFDEAEFGYFCKKAKLLEALENNWIQEDMVSQTKEMIEFWDRNSTLARYKALRPKDESEAMANAILDMEEGSDWAKECYIGFVMQRMAEVSINFNKLIEKGIPGLTDEIKKYRKEAEGDTSRINTYDAMLLCLQLLQEVCYYYADMADEMSKEGVSEERRKELCQLSSALKKITENKPETFFEAVQLMWLYATLSGVDNYGRMDTYFGDFVSNDLLSGRLTRDKALAMLLSLYRLMADAFPAPTGRIVVGGKGRRNEKNADEFAMLAMDAIVENRNSTPQLSLRCYRGMNEFLYRKGLETIAEGITFPVLHNDDVNIPATAKAFNVTEEDATQYILSNCGETDIYHRSFSSPNGAVSHLKIVETTLFNGWDIVLDRPMGIQTGEFEKFESFDELWTAYNKQTEYYLDIIAERMDLIFRVAEEESPDLFAAMLHGSCLEKGCGLLAGTDFKGFQIEAHSLMNAADSLTAIKELVYEKKLISPSVLLDALKKNFEGYQREWLLMHKAPKYGNNIKEADDMAKKVFELVNDLTRKQMERYSLHFSLATHISVDGYVHMGRWVGASSDGRRAGEPTTNSNNPRVGMDKNGALALLHSMAKFNPDNCGGFVNHIMLSKDVFREGILIVKALVDGFFESGGCYLCISVLSEEEYKNALAEPEKYPNLMVRVGGFSALFVTLPRELQQDIIKRTRY